MKHVSKHSPWSLKCRGVFDSEECMLAKGSTYHKSTVYLNVYVTVHGKRAHLTRTYFSRFFIRAGCSETALQNDAICSDVTRSTRTLYAQIANRGVLPVKINSTRMRITLSDSPRLSSCTRSA